MFGKSIEYRAVAVAVEILSPAHVVCLVHTYMYPAGSKTLRKRIEDVFEKYFHPLVANKQNIRAVEMRVVLFIPMSQTVKMRESLNTRYQFYAHFQRVSVHFFKLGFRISAAHIAEHGLGVNFVSIFGIQHRRVIAEQSDYAYYFFDCFHRRDGVSRTVYHKA